MPGLLPLGDGERPVKQIAHMREDLRGRARLVSDVEAGEVVGSVAQSFAAAVHHRSHRVAKKLTGRVGCFGHKKSLLGKVGEKSLNAETQCAQRKKLEENVLMLPGQAGMNSGASYCATAWCRRGRSRRAFAGGKR